MDWSARLAERRESFQERPDGALTEPTKRGFVSSVSVQDGRSQKNEAAPRDRLRRLAAAMCLPVALVDGLAGADLAECAGLPDEVLRAYLHMLRDAALRARGRVPADETAPALCAHCGPVWLAPDVAAVAPVVAGWPRVLGCPWCHVKNRTATPRPLVACEDCRHFAPNAVNTAAGLGQCGAGCEPLPSEPLHYPHAKRQCGRFDPRGTP